MTASARGCPSAPSSIRTACGTPLSVRMKSSAVSERTTLRAWLFTNTGTSTRFERAVSVGTCESGDSPPLCALAAFKKHERNNAAKKANFNRFILKAHFPSTLRGLKIATYDHELAQS